MRQVLHEFACLSSYEHARFPNLNLQKTICFLKHFCVFSGLPKWVYSSIEFAHKTRFHDLNYIRLVSTNDIKTNWFLTISHCVKSSFISMSSFIYKFWKHKNVKKSIGFCTFFDETTSAGHRSDCQLLIWILEPNTKFAFFRLRSRSNVAKQNR